MIDSTADERLALRCRIADLEQELFEIRCELAKYLSMNPGETIIGGVRNLIQACILNEDTAKKAMSLWRSMHEDKSESGCSG